MLSIDDHDGTTLLRWHDGENRFRHDSIAAWNTALDELEARPGPLAAVVVGEGKYFSNGLDLEWLNTVDDGMTMIADVHRLFGRLLVFPGYLVGAINGHCFAGGAMIAMTFDTRVMRTDRGYWCLPEADLGLALTDEMATVVTAKLPRTTAHDAIVTGRRYDAHQALDAGIVEHVAQAVDVLPTAIALAEAMAGKDRTTLAAHKRWLYGDAAMRCGFTA